MAETGLASSGGFVHRVLRARGAWVVVFASVLLSLVGVSAIDLANTDSVAPGSWLAPVAMKQARFLLIGIVAAFIIALPPYRWFGYFSWLFYAAMMAILIFLLVPLVPASIVTPRNGARSWIDIGPIDLQPSELAKIAMVLVLARYLRFRANHRRFWGLVPPGIIAAIPVALITLQPDLGTATLFVPVLFAVLVAAGAKLKHLTLIVLLAALAAPAAYPMLKPHQKQRIEALFRQFKGDTSADQDINMQSVTAQRLIGAGGLAGQPRERAATLLKYNPLPERHNDMIFAVIADRHGFLGGVLVLALYFAWIAGALITAGSTRDPFGRLVCVGLAAFIAGQVFINVGMNTGLLPIIGITLPYVSYGGSSLVTVWLMTGLIMNIAARRPRPPVRHSFEFHDDE